MPFCDRSSWKPLTTCCTVADTLDAAAPYNGNYTIAVNASDKARMNLSGLKTIVAPASNADTLI